MTRRDLLDDMRIKVTNKCLANSGELWRYPATYPDVHLYETGRLHFFDVNRIAVIENCEMRAKASAIHDAAQVRNRDFTQRHALHRLTSETQHSDAERMVSRLFVATDIASPDEGPKQIACRTLREMCGPTNCRSAQSLMLAGQ